MNAKEELVKVINKRPIILCASIEKLSRSSYSVEKVIELPIGYTSNLYDQFLKDLDFQYDNGYGIQQLSGTIWLINGDWFERGEYDGSEWWEYKTCPQIPEYLNPL